MFVIQSTMVADFEFVQDNTGEIKGLADITMLDIFHNKDIFIKQHRDKIIELIKAVNEIRKEKKEC